LALACNTNSALREINITIWGPVLRRWGNAFRNEFQNLSYMEEAVVSEATFACNVGTLR
jgi:hypothetical protein